MELLQVVPSCVASVDDVCQTDQKEYVTVKIRKKCTKLHSDSQCGLIGKFVSVD